MRPAVCMVVVCVAVTPSFPKTVLSREVRSALATLRKLVEVRSVGNVIGLLSLGRRSPRRGDRRSVFNPGAFRGQPTAISALRAIWQRRWAGWATFVFRVHGGTHFMGEGPAQKRGRNDEKRRRLPTGGSGERFAAACASKKQAKEGDREGNGLCLQDSQSTSSRSRLSKMTVLDHSEVSVSGACEGGAGASSMTATRVVPESISERTTRPSCPL